MNSKTCQITKILGAMTVERKNDASSKDNKRKVKSPTEYFGLDIKRDEDFEARIGADITLT